MIKMVDERNINIQIYFKKNAEYWKLEEGKSSTF